ncbi:MAG: hypothetical protein IJC67_06515, partial [Clostridia bacterium]|nr:hypothetical protein [Clostridia bacterium]
NTAVIEAIETYGNELLAMAKAEEIDLEELGEKDETLLDLLKMIRGGSGIRAHLGTSDLVKIEERIEAGDTHAKLIYQAFAYQVAKCIGGLCAAASRVPDRIILTGGAAHSKMLTDWICERVGRFAPISLMAGEYEMEALAAGALRVLRGEEDAKEFVLA